MTQPLFAPLPATNKHLDQQTALVHFFESLQHAHQLFGTTVSRSFVSYCLWQLRSLPSELQLEAVLRLRHMAQDDYRYNLVVALWHVAADRFELAIPLLRSVWTSYNDLQAQDALIDADAEYARQQGMVHSVCGDLREYLAQSFCPVPWQYFEVGRRHRAYLCCPGSLPVPVGDLTRQNFDDVWNSGAARQVRASILDGSFRYCNKLACPDILARSLPSRRTFTESPVSDVPTAARSVSWLPFLEADVRTVLTGPPSLAMNAPSPARIAIGNDRSCNLACPSCRVAVRNDRQDERELTEQVFRHLYEGPLRKAYRIRINGAGELFASSSCRRLLKLLTRSRFPHLSFEIITNGLLFDRNAYEEFDLRDRVSWLYISIDAATKETYHIVRYPGSFDRLLANLKFVNDLREKEGQVFDLAFGFVVSALNFREMSAFVALAREFRATATFCRMGNWGHLSHADFAQLNIADPFHPDHEAFLCVLSSPELRDPCVDTRNLIAASWQVMGTMGR